MVDQKSISRILKSEDFGADIFVSNKLSVMSVCVHGITITHRYLVVVLNTVVCGSQSL